MQASRPLTLIKGKKTTQNGLSRENVNGLKYRHKQAQPDSQGVPCMRQVCQRLHEPNNARPCVSHIKRVRSVSSEMTSYDTQHCGCAFFTLLFHLSKNSYRSNEAAVGIPRIAALGVIDKSIGKGLRVIGQRAGRAQAQPGSGTDRLHCSSHSRVMRTDALEQQHDHGQPM